MTLEEAFAVTKPLSKEEQNHLPNIVSVGSTDFIVDPERPICINCGGRLNMSGVCTRGCGMVMKEIR